MSRDASPWILRSQRRTALVAAMREPLTPRQLAHKTSLARDTVSRVLAELEKRRLVVCLTPRAQRSRLYALTRGSMRCHRQLTGHSAQSTPPHFDWELYGWICFSQRSAVLLALDRASKPSEIRKRARSRDPSVRINTSNIRDILRWFRKHALARQVPIRKRKHPLWELTETGKALREQLQRAEAHT